MSLLLITICLAIITSIQPEYIQLKKQSISTEHRSYLLCRRPLSGIGFFYNILLKRNYSANDLDNYFEHHHFFLINDIIRSDENNTLSEIWNLYSQPIAFPTNAKNNNLLVYNDLPIMIKADKSCKENTFENFGFFDNHHIKCNEHIKDYTECHSMTYNEKTMKKAIDMMQRDLIKYRLYPNNENSQYNCQTFTKHMISAYFIIEEGMGPKCAITLSDSNISRSNSIRDNLFGLFNIPIPNNKTKFNYNWISNPYYNK